MTKFLLREAKPGDVVSIRGQVHQVQSVSAVPYGDSGTVQMYSSTLNETDEWIPQNYATTWDWNQYVERIHAA